VTLKFYREVYFSDTEACQGLHLFSLCDMMRYMSIHCRHGILLYVYVYELCRKVGLTTVFKE